MSSIQNSQKFRERAAQLRDQAALHGITMMPAEAADLLADRLTAVAQQLGISQRWALDRYVTDGFLAILIQTLATHAATYQEAVQAAEPVSLSTTDAGRVLATLGMTLKLAAQHAEQTPADSMAILTDGADTIVTIGAALTASGATAQIELGGQALVWTRGILVQAITLLRTGQWACPCTGTHGPEPTCTLVPALARNLTLAGGWLSPEPAEPAPAESGDAHDGW